MKLRHLVLLVLLSLAGTLPRAALAQEASVIERARELHKQGAALLEAGQLAEAHAALAEALRIHPHYATAGVLGTCELRLGRHRDAAEHLEKYVREAPPSASTREREEAARLLGQARERVAELRVVVDVAGAQVWVDGVEVGRSPLGRPLFVEPGERSVRARGPGSAERTTTLALMQGESHTVSLSLGAEEGGGSVSYPLVATGLAIGGAAMVVGGVLLGVSASHRGEVDDIAAGLDGEGAGCPIGSAAPDCVAYDEAAQAADGLFNAGLPVLLAGAAVAAGTGIYWAVAAANEGSAPAVALVPLGVGGLAMVGTF